MSNFDLVVDGKLSQATYAKNADGTAAANSPKNTLVVEGWTPVSVNLDRYVLARVQYSSGVRAERILRECSQS